MHISSGVIDTDKLEKILQLYGEDDYSVIVDLIEIYNGTAPDQVKQMELALANKKYETLAQAAHSLKSSSGNVGAIKLSYLCAKTEEAAEKDRPDLLLLPNLVTEIRMQFDLVYDELNKYIEEKMKN